MDKHEVSARLVKALEGLGVTLSLPAAEALVGLRDELLRWNAKVNLTAITAPEEVLEKHFVDSLAVLPDLSGDTLLDVGAGAGFPGVPLAVALPELRVTLVDAVAKKVGFIKHAAARLGLAGRVTARQARLEGTPESEGLGGFDTVVSRALMDVEPWLRLASHYVRPGGRVLAMVARAGDASAYEAQAQAAGLRFLGARTYALPWSGDPRAVLRFERPA